MDFIAKIAASKMGQLKDEIMTLRERLQACTDETQKAEIRKTLREKETYYHILADRLKQRSRF